MKSTSSRKGQTSITHLMSFALPPRPQSQYHNHYSHARNGRRNPTWGLGSGYHAVDKARYDGIFVLIRSLLTPYRYVHANYRFIVNPNGDYHAQAVDADVPLDWSMVLQVLASAQTQAASCPICLSEPVAPRMAKCGHIFCLPCLLRYMHSTDDTMPIPEKKARWKKCPICWDSVYVSETRPVRWFTGQEAEAPQEGGDVVLRLIMRQPGSTLALPRDGADALPKTEDIPWYFAAEVIDYARVMKGTEDYMAAQFNDEIEQLKLQEREDELMFGEETQWTKKAVATITDSIARLEGVGTAPSVLEQPAERIVKSAPIQHSEAGSDVPDMYVFQHAMKSGQSSAGSATPQSIVQVSPSLGSTKASSVSLHLDATEAFVPLPRKVMEHLDPDLVSAPHIAEASPTHARGKAPATHHHHPSDSPFYFYQALLHYYLSPLDIRILKAAFGDFAAFPATILPRVERVSTGHIVDDELRRRAKYLAHLPYGCEVGFLECDWTDIVTPGILERFKPDIERRRKKNKDKEAKEEKERVRAEKEEDDKRWAAARRKRPSIPREPFADNDLQAMSSLDIQGPTSSPVNAGSTSVSPPYSSSRRPGGSAFASLASPSTSPVAPRTVWGTTAVAPTSPHLHPVPIPHDNPENDGWLQGWERDLLHEEDIVAQVQASSMDEEGTLGKHGLLNNKKKKGKKITLMTTNARRGA